MIGLGIWEIVILLVCGAFFFVGPLVVVLLLVASRPWGGQPAIAPQPKQGLPQPQASDMAASSVDVVARLIQRFCPQCRSPLAADAPEGLCPACLMAGGLEGPTPTSPVNGLAATTPPSGSQPPTTGEWADLQQHFPQLEILELLGRGGMGSVYKARQKNLDRIIALKVIPPDAAKDPAFAERFARESRAMARLNHPSIVTVYDSGHEGELYWLMMEYVDGVNLRHALRAGRLEPSEALAIVPQICDALQYAHDQGVVHRDIKPENVLLDRSGRVKIADFGLAKLLGKGPDDFTLTRPQQVMGTPRYMAPEQIERPSAVDHRADIYSLGVVLYEMLTGELPLGRFEPPSHKVELDVRIDQIVLRALEKAPERRYQRASQVKTELASAVSWPVANLPSPLAGEGLEMREHDVQSPTWHTPAPASKSKPTGYPGNPDVPLGPVLGVAIGIVMGVLMMTGGLAAGIYGLVSYPPFAQQWWAWVGAGFGCIVGGLGSAGGSYNTYRQMAGSEDLMHSPRVTWFDWMMRAYLLLGLVLLLTGLFRLLGLPVDTAEFPGLVLLGGIIVLQGATFVLLRMSRIEWRSPSRPSLSPAQLAARRRVAGPAVGLMITGMLGLLPLLLALLAVPAWTVVPQMGPPTEQSDSPWDQVSPPPPLVPGLVPLTAANPHIAPLLAGIDALAPPVLLAQSSGRPIVVWFVFAAGFFLVNAAFSITLIVGGWRMRQLKSYGLAMVAAIIAVLPCTFGWFLGLPMGIWALATLLSGDVRDAFDREPDEPVPPPEPRMKPEGAREPNQANGNRPVRAVIAIASIVVVVAALGVLLSLVIPAIQAARETARQMQSMNNLRQIGIALHMYHDEHRSFPPAVVTDAAGQPLYSGRVLLLPYLDQQPLYDAFDLSQSWNSPANRSLSHRILDVFSDPSQEDDSRARASYQFITGAGTMFEAGQRVSLTDCTDGLANTMVMVEVKGSAASWAEPRDLDVSRPRVLPEGNHPGGNLILFGDGRVRFVEKASLTPSKVRALATSKGGERMEVDPADFARLLEGLRAETFDPGKLSFIEAIGESESFTSEQVHQLLSEFDFDSERADAAVALHPRVIDPENFYLALDAFDHETGFSAFTQKLALDRPAKPLSEDATGNAVTDQELAALVARLKAASLDQGKLAFLKMIVHGRIFTCDQAAQLLKQFAFDTDREKAAIAIYPRLSDPKNFYRTLEVFTFDPGRQSVRKQLKLE